MPRLLTQPDRLLDLLAQNGSMLLEEIAKEFGIKETSVTSIVTKARRLLRNGDRILTGQMSDGLVSWTYYLLEKKTGQLELEGV